jgi:predicted nucleic acid-binding protein
MLSDLIRDGRVQMLGCIRQEVLQGNRHPEQFERLRTTLRMFEDRVPEPQEYELAAEFFNVCRGHGIQGSSTDVLIAACSVSWDIPILTRDQDFKRFTQHVPVKLVQI